VIPSQNRPKPTISLTTGPCVRSQIRRWFLRLARARQRYPLLRSGITPYKKFAPNVGKFSLNTAPSGRPVPWAARHADEAPPTRCLGAARFLLLSLVREQGRLSLQKRALSLRISLFVEFWQQISCQNTVIMGRDAVSGDEDEVLPGQTGRNRHTRPRAGGTERLS